MQELEVNARQYPDNDEGMGISLEQALTDTQVRLNNCACRCSTVIKSNI